MKALLDINILLDVVLSRHPWVEPAIELCNACSEGKIDGYVAGITVPTLFYVVRRTADLAKAREAVRMCLESFEVLPVNRASLELARTMPLSDFEDNVQIACAMLGGMDWIITRDKGLSHLQVTVLDAKAAVEAIPR